MARYVYEASKVNTSIDYLNESINILQPTEAALAAGFNQLAQVQGAQFIDVGSNQSVICKLPSEAQNYINDLKKAIEGKRSEIEDYNNAPWYKKLFASIGMGVAKFGEGFLTAFENIGDAAVSLVGFTAGIFGKNDFQASCAEFIKRDLSGELVSNVYKDGTFIGKYSAISSTGVVSNICKGFGTAIGYYAMGKMAGGLNKVVRNPLDIGSVGVNSFVAGAGGLGSGTETALIRGKTFNEAFFQGIKTGAIQGGAAYAAGRIGDKIKSDKIARDAAKATGTPGAEAVAKDGAGEAAKSITSKAVEKSDDIKDVAGKTKDITKSAKDAAMKSVDVVDDLDGVGGSAKRTLKLDRAGSSGTKKLTKPLNVDPELTNVGDNLVESVTTGVQSVDKGGKILSKFEKIGEKVGIDEGGAEKIIEKGADSAEKVAANAQKTIKGVSKVNSASYTGNINIKAPVTGATAGPSLSSSVGTVGTSAAKTGIIQTAKNTITSGVSKVSNFAGNIVTSHPTASNVVAKSLYGATVVGSTTANTNAKAAATPLAKINTTATANKVDNTPVVQSNPNYNPTTKTVSTPKNTYTYTQYQTDKAAKQVTQTTPTTTTTTASAPVATSQPTHNSSSYTTAPKSFGGGSSTTSSSTPKSSLTTSLATSIGQKAKTAEPLADAVNQATNTKFDHPASSSTTTTTTGSNNHNDYSGMTNYQIPAGSTTAITGGTKYPTIKSQVEGSVAKNNISTTTLGSSGSTHAGGGYSGGGYSFGGSSAVTSDGSIGVQDTKGTLASSITKTKSDKNDVSRIAVAEEVEEEVETTANNYVVPTSAALSAAAAAGIGAKLVMDKKEKDKEKEREEREEDDDLDFEYGSEFKDIDDLDDNYTVVESY